MDQDGFLDQLAGLMRRRGETIAGLAERIGVSSSTLSRIRAGHQVASPDQAARLADALALVGEVREAFIAQALLLGLPESVRGRMPDGERQAPAFHDGWWLGYSRSFHNDGRVQRSLLRVEGANARLQVGERGILRYTYHGTCETLGDKLFIRVSEDRGAVEYVQITCHCLFDLAQPSFLWGLVCGISGTDVRHPVSWPTAARMVLLHAASLDADAGLERKLIATLGGFAPDQLRGVWPAFLGSDDHLRLAMQLDDDVPLDAAVVRATDNRLGDDTVLRAGPMG